jgi:DNA modification methylase
VPELVWKGKRRRGRAGLDRRGPELSTEEVYGSKDAPWYNRLILGDASCVLPRIAEPLAGRVALVYVDPPFYTGSAFEFRAVIPGAPPGAPRISVPAYRDEDGLDAWLSWFDSSMRQLHTLLVEGGSLYVHLDAHAAHYAKVVLDEIFGADAFQREIVWRIGWVSGFKSRTRGWIRNHDTLLFYAKGGKPRTFNKEYIPYPPGYVRRDGAPSRASGYPIDDVWNGSEIDRMDSIQIVSFSGEKVGYPTQKNESLVARIVRASSNEGDLVLDVFAGSGTTAVVAEKLARRWIASDRAPIAIHTARKRLLSGKLVAPFVVQRAGPQPRGPERFKARLNARVDVEGRHATIVLGSFSVPSVGVSREARAAVTHWSQWIEGWSVDWDHRGGAHHAASRFWRTRRDQSLPLSTTHAYPQPGRYEALVKVFDVLGGVSTRALALSVL